jgi:hypothetical protein
MTWLMLRDLKTYFAQKGSKLLSIGEQKLREHMKREAALYETGTAKGSADNDVAFLRCVTVKEQLLTALRAHSDRGQLRQLGMISGSELRATVLGDKGGAYTKLLLVVWDVVECQSPKNTVLLGMYRSGEEYELIAKVFGSVFDQLAALTSERALGLVPSALSAAAVSTTNLPRRAVAAIGRERRTCNAHLALPRLLLLSPPPSLTLTRTSLARSLFGCPSDTAR